MCARACARVCMCVRARACVCTCVRMRVCVCARARVCVWSARFPFPSPGEYGKVPAAGQGSESQGSSVSSPVFAVMCI